MKQLLVAFVLSLALGTHGEFACEPPRTSVGPLPPVLPGSFHMVYEKNDQLKKRTAFYEIWYDWKNQTARVDEVADGKGRTLLFDFESGSGFAFDVPRPGTDEMTDERSFLCQYFPIKIDSPDLYFYDPSEKPLRMLDVYHALLFGGPFRYAFVGTATNETSRFISANVFESCVYDDRIGQKLNIKYYWSVEDSEERPIRCERTGDDVQEILSVIRFDRDPKFAKDTFLIPRYMDCVGIPVATEVKDLPSLSDDFAWREETLTYSKDDAGKVYGMVKDSYKEIWVTDQYKLARLDWTPTAAQVENTFLKNFAGKPLAVIADISFGAVFITNKNSGQCVVQPLTAEFPLSKKDKNGFTLKTAAELVGLDGPRVLKGEYLERGNPVFVYSSNFTIFPNDEVSTLHETTLRFDLQQAVDSYGAYEFVPVSQLTRRLSADPEGQMPARISFEQTDYYRYRSEHYPMHVYSAPGCIVHHKRRHFELRFASSTLDMINKRKNVFLDELRHQIYLRGELGTVMRVQDVDLIEDSDVVARMTLLEPLDEISTQKAVTIDEAAQKIAEVVNEGNMAVPFEFKDVEHLTALENSFKEIKLDGNAAILKRSVRDVEKAVAVAGPGYSLGSFIAVCFGAFILGLGVGVLIVYLKDRAAQTSSPDEVPLGDIERNQGEEDLNRPGPSGWRQNEMESIDE